jgi:CHAD domain-containing protein
MNFAAALAEKIREHASSVRTSLSRIETADDARLAHRARIEGKRLRYLLEPIGATSGIKSGQAVKKLRRLQDLLGDLNDANVAAATVREARHEAKASRGRTREGRPGAGLRPGLLAMERLADRRAGRLFARLRSEVLESRGSAIIDPALEVAAALEARAHGS